MLASFEKEDDYFIQEYQVKDSLRIEEEMRKLFRETADLTCLEKGDCILLLRSFKWNSSKMNDVYYDDSEKYLKRAGTQFREDEVPEEIECEICCEVTDKPLGLACGHYFCKNCWKEHIEERFKKSIILDCPCMASGCKCLVTHDLISQISKTLADRYWYFLKKDYVEAQGNVFCPNPSCGRAIIILTSDRQSDNIECNCGQKFCFKCLKTYHSPVTCQNLEAWDSLGNKDDYLLLTAKPCYHCGLLCERTQGCNHMTCPKCRGEWCWMCLGDWKTHGERTGGFYSCNIYNEGKSKGNELDKKRESSKAYHDKYQHYYDRWLNHNSLYQQTIERKTKNMPIVRHLFETMPRAVDRLEDAFDTLILARIFLKCSYIHGYFETEKLNSTQQQFFNHIQAKIEVFTEMLGEIMFRDVDTYDPDEIASKASSLKKIIEHFSTM